MPAMPAVVACLIRSSDRFGDLVVRVGVPLADEYLEFLGGRCRRIRCWLPHTT
jgi:integrase/recombinase XerD